MMQAERIRRAVSDFKAMMVALKHKNGLERDTERFVMIGRG